MDFKYKSWQWKKLKAIRRDTIVQCTRNGKSQSYEKKKPQLEFSKIFITILETYLDVYYNARIVHMPWPNAYMNHI